MLIHNLEVAAITEFEEGFDRVAGGVAGIGREEQLEAAVGLVHHKIGVPVGASDCVSDQTLGALHFLFHDGFATPYGLEKRASRFCGDGSQLKESSAADK